VVVSRADITVEDLRFTMHADVHAQRTAGWPLPGPDDPLRITQVLVDGAPRVLRVGWSTILDLGPQGAYRVVGSQSAPETQASSAPWMPLNKPTVLDPEADWVPEIWRDMDTKLAAAPLGDSSKVLLLGRPGGPDFRPSEVARLGYLAGIVATVLG